MRRLLLALTAALLAWPAWAIEAPRAPEAPRPVQLSLDFGPAAAVPTGPAPWAQALPAAPSASASPAAVGITPRAAAVPSARTAARAALPAAPAAQALPAPVSRALAAGDPHAFYQAARAADYEPPQDDDRQQALYSEGAERAAAERAFARAAADPKRWPRLETAAKPASGEAQKPGRKTKLDYERFARLVWLSPRLSTDPYRDTEAKRRILLAAGYTHLIGPKGRRIPLSIADEARVGRAFAHTLETLARRGKKR